MTHCLVLYGQQVKNGFYSCGKGIKKRRMLHDGCKLYEISFSAFKNKVNIDTQPGSLCIICVSLHETMAELGGVTETVRKV